jgi:hypothetical protein
MRWELLGCFCGIGVVSVSAQILQLGPDEALGRDIGSVNDEVLSLSLVKPAKWYYRSIKRLIQQSPRAHTTSNNPSAGSP